MTVIIGPGSTIDVLDPADPRRSRQRLGSFVANLHDRPAMTEYVGEQRRLELELSPLTAHRLLDIPMHELTGRVVDLGDVLARVDRSPPQRLQGVPDWEARFALLDSFIAAVLAESRDPSPELTRAVSRLRRSGGATPIAALATEAGWSQRRLVAAFRDDA